MIWINDANRVLRLTLVVGRLAYLDTDFFGHRRGCAGLDALRGGAIRKPDRATTIATSRETI